MMLPAVGLEEGDGCPLAGQAERNLPHRAGGRSVRLLGVSRGGAPFLTFIGSTALDTHFRVVNGIFSVV